MGNWTKKTEQEKNEARKRNDYTNGYEFWPWLWYMRKWYCFAFLLNLGGGIACFTVFFKEVSKYGFEGDVWVGLAAGCFFGILIPIIIRFLLRRDYKEGKQGISR